MFHASNCCRMCINICNVYQSLYQADGRKSEVHKLMDKYFTPMFLDMERGRHLTVICSECWRHIFDFHNFQNSVLLAQRKLVEREQRSAAFLSARDDQQSNMPIRVISDVPYRYGSNSASVANYSSEVLTMTARPMFSKNNSSASFYNAEVDQGSANFLSTRKDQQPNTPITVISDVPYCNESNSASVATYDSEVLTMTTGSTLSTYSGISEEGPQRTAADGQHSNTPMTVEKDVSSLNELITQSISTTVPTLTGYQSGVFLIDGETKQRPESVVQSQIENLLQDSCLNHNLPESTDANMSSLKNNLPESRYADMNSMNNTHSGSDFKLQIDQQSVTTLRSEIDDSAMENGLPVLKGDNFFSYNKFRPVNTDADGNITKNTTPVFAQNPVTISRGYDNSWKSDSSDDDSDWEESDDPIGVFIGGDFNNKKSEISLSETFSDTASEWSDDQNPLLASRTFKTGENESNNSNFSTQLEGNSEGIANSTTSSKSSIDTQETRTRRLDLERLQTVEEYDDFIAGWRPTLQCVICTESCSRFTQLLKHFNEQHPNEECHILCCHLKLRHRYEIEKHIHYHIKPQAFKCEACLICFSHKRGLAQHLSDLHSEKPEDTFKCPMCSKCFSSKGTLSTHIKYVNHKSTKLKTTLRYTCNECGKDYSSLYLLANHKRIVHLNQSEIYKCTICDKAYAGRSELNGHIMGVHRGHKLTCLHCPKTYTYKSDLRKHTIRHHPMEWMKEKKIDDSSYRKYI